MSDAFFQKTSQTPNCRLRFSKDLIIPNFSGFSVDLRERDETSKLDYTYWDAADLAFFSEDGHERYKSELRTGWTF